MRKVWGLLNLRVREGRPLSGSPREAEPPPAPAPKVGGWPIRFVIHENAKTPKGWSDLAEDAE